MSDAMVTGRMDSSKKSQGARILANSELSASQAINLMYDRLIEEGSADFLSEAQSGKSRSSKWQKAALFIDSLTEKRASRFHDMSKAETKMDRLRARGLA